MQYRVYKGSTLLTTTTNKLTYTATGLAPLTDYTFGVSTWNGLREGAKKTLTLTTRGVQFIIPTTIAVGTVVTLRRLDYAIGLVALGLEPSGDFGGANASTLAAKVVASASGSSTVELTTADTTFADQTKMTLQATGKYAALNGVKGIYYG